MKQYKVYIFDFDGTLVDSFKSLYKVFSAAYEAVGIKIKYEQILYLSRASLVEGYQKLNAPLDQASINKFAETIEEEIASSSSLIDTKLFPETIDVIKTLYENGATLAITTSNSAKHVLEVLKTLNLSSTYFSAFVGHEHTDKHKPDPDPILKTLEMINYRGNLDDVCYVGDGLNDMITAKNAHIDGILVERFNEYEHYKKIKIKSLKELL